MRVRHKISLVAVSGIFLVSVFAFFLLRTLFMNHLETTETTTVTENYHSVISIIHHEELSLENSIKDWAYWDDTFNYINGTNRDYVKVNLQDDTLTSLKLNYMGFFNKDGDTVFAKTAGISAAEENSFKQALYQRLPKGSDYNKLLSSSNPVTGLLMVSGKPLFFSMSPVTTSDKITPNDGVVVFCRLVDQNFINYLQDVLQVNIEFDSAQDSKVLQFLVKSNQSAYFDNTILHIDKTPDSITTYVQLDNVYHMPSMFMVLKAGRPMYLDGLAILKYSSIAFIIVFLIIGGLSLFVLERIVFRRIEKLNQFMNSVRDKKKISDGISLPGNDEISYLADSANNMLKEIESYYDELRITEERFKLIMEATNDGYFDFDLIEEKSFINPDWLRYIGYEDLEGYLDLKQTLNIIHPEDRRQYIAAFNECLDGNNKKLVVEFRARKKTGEWLWFQIRGEIAEYDDSKKPKRLIGTITEITERKKNEEEILYLSQTDVVTTLKNRTYVETQLEQADKCILCQSWIILGDINGLKLINDTFGQQEGDRLLRAIGKVLRNCCSENDIPARWGGDEFIIFIQDSQSEYVDNLIWEIKSACSNLRDIPAPVSISWGRAKKDTQNNNMKAVIKLAEERMYRNKLLENRSAKSSILSSLEQSLHEKHIETEEHTRRIAHICVQVGKRMGLTQEELDEVALLGLLHDIGKIGIREAILLKPGKLTDEEWEVMKTHTEIGFRIAQSTPELAHVAEEILSHHERYDGNGYPQGLKGQEIPKLSRLLSIVDSYDVMTHARHYKKEAMSMEEAIQEVKNCSGKQFDPEMVEQFLTILQENPSAFETQDLHSSTA